MQSTEIKKALSLLKEAQLLLKDSKVANLQKTAGYLGESLQLLRQNTD